MTSRQQCQHPDGCIRDAYTKGWCATHYARVRRNGFPGSASTERPPPKGRAEGTCKHPDGCDSPVWAKGWCSRHYNRQLRNGGDPGPTDWLRPKSWAGINCLADGCEREAQARGYCWMHWNRVQKTGNPGQAEPLLRRNKGSCSVDGCERLAKTLQFCEMHYQRFSDTGDPGPAHSLRVLTIPGATEKHCGLCDRILPLDGFALANNRKDGRQTRCRWCSRVWAFSKLHGIAISDVIAFVRENEFRGCAICGSEEALVIDHCHKTMVIRGMLCRRCNSGLGMFRDDPAMLRAAAPYLEERQE